MFSFVTKLFIFHKNIMNTENYIQPLDHWDFFRKQILLDNFHFKISLMQVRRNTI